MLWRFFIRIYSKAQIALRETFAEPPAVIQDIKPVPSLLKEANLETVVIGIGSPVAGKLIRELQLRTLTGASVVGIERNGAGILNPGPDEELLAHDHVLLLGNRNQLEAGRKMLLAEQGRLH